MVELYLKNVCLKGSKAYFWYLKATKVNFPYVSLYKTDMALHLKIYILYNSLNYADMKINCCLCLYAWNFKKNYLKAKKLSFIICISNVIPGMW